MSLIIDDNYENYENYENNSSENSDYDYSNNLSMQEEIIILLCNEMDKFINGEKLIHNSRIFSKLKREVFIKWLLRNRQQ